MRTGAVFVTEQEYTLEYTYLNEEDEPIIEVNASEIINTSPWLPGFCLLS